MARPAGASPGIKMNASRVIASRRPPRRSPCPRRRRSHLELRPRDLPRDLPRDRPRTPCPCSRREIAPREISSREIAPLSQAVRAPKRDPPPRPPHRPWPPRPQRAAPSASQHLGSQWGGGVNFELAENAKSEIVNGASRTTNKVYRTKITRARCKAYAQTMSMTLDFDSDAFYCAFTRRAIPIVLGGRTYFYPAQIYRGRRGGILIQHPRYTQRYTMAPQRQLGVIVAVLSLWSLAVVAHLAERRRHARR